MNGYDKLMMLMEDLGGRQSYKNPIFIGEMTGPDSCKVNGIELDKDDLIFAEHLVKHKYKIKIDWKTEDRGGGAGEAAFASHNHDIKGTKEYEFVSVLKAGDTVLCLRVDEGTYAVVERLVTL